MKNLIFSTISLFCFSVFGKAEPRPHSTSDLIFRTIIPGIFFVLVIVAEIWSRKKQNTKTKELQAKEKPVKILEYCKIFFGYNDEHSARAAVLGGRINVSLCNVLLFHDRIGLVTEKALEIGIKDINSITMKKVLWEEILQVNYNEISKSGADNIATFYLKGDKEDLLCIKNFIEERMNRPQIIDLT